MKKIFHFISALLALSATLLLGGWRQAEDRAYFVREADEGYLKVAFFGPFYGSHVIFELDRQNYQYAFVAGPDTSYLWLLSRMPAVSRELMERFIAQTSQLEFDTEALILVGHAPVTP